MSKIKKIEIFLKFPKTQKNHYVYVRGPVGTIEGRRLVFDSMEVWSCVPRVTWNVFCFLVCESIADTADFRREDKLF